MFCGLSSGLPRDGTRTFFFKKDLIHFFLERGEGMEKEKERNINQIASHKPPTGDLACNPGICPDRVSTRNLSVCGTMLNALSHTSQGSMHLLRVCGLACRCRKYSISSGMGRFHLNSLTTYFQRSARNVLELPLTFYRM